MHRVGAASMQYNVRFRISQVKRRLQCEVYTDAELAPIQLDAWCTEIRTGEVRPSAGVGSGGYVTT
jgi:hypothetical protein